jgi:hypothetical protein
VIRTQHITIKGTPEAFVHREHSYNGQTKVAYSHMLICPKCCQIWATLRFLQDDDGLVWPVAQFCEECASKDDWHPVPGSILKEEGWGVIDNSLLAALPPELVKREFNLHMKAYS